MLSTEEGGRSWALVMATCGQLAQSASTCHKGLLKRKLLLMFASNLFHQSLQNYIWLRAAAAMKQTTGPKQASAAVRSFSYRIAVGIEARTYEERFGCILIAEAKSFQCVCTRITAKVRRYVVIAEYEARGLYFSWTWAYSVYL